MDFIAEGIEKFSELAGGIAEGKRTIGSEMAVAIDEAVEEAAEVIGIAAEVACREMFEVTFAKLGEEAGPLEGIEVDVDNLGGRGDDRIYAGDVTEALGELYGDGLFIWAESPRDAADFGIA